MEHFNIDGKRVLDGKIIFDLLDTHGLPLSISFQLCLDRECVLDWAGFIETAIDKLWDFEKILRTIAEAVGDSSLSSSQKGEIKKLAKMYLIFRDKLKYK